MSSSWIRLVDISCRVFALIVNSSGSSSIVISSARVVQWMTVYYQRKNTKIFIFIHAIFPDCTKQMHVNERWRLAIPKLRWYCRRLWADKYPFFVQSVQYLYVWSFFRYLYKKLWSIYCWHRLLNWSVIVSFCSNTVFSEERGQRILCPVRTQSGPTSNTLHLSNRVD